MKGLYSRKSSVPKVVDEELATTITLDNGPWWAGISISLFALCLPATSIISVNPLHANAADIPVSIAIKDATTIAAFHAEGVQIYECKAGLDNKMNWQFREPLATLLEDGKTVGRHFAGPGWELIDGSSITGKLASQAPGATQNDIPLLRLGVVDHQRDGVLSKVTAVQRLDTKGGVFSGACDQLGALHLEPYTAHYVFLRN